MTLRSNALVAFKWGGESCRGISVSAIFFDTGTPGSWEISLTLSADYKTESHVDAPMRRGGDAYRGLLETKMRLLRMNSVLEKVARDGRNWMGS